METNELIRNLANQATPVRRLPSLSRRFGAWVILSLFAITLLIGMKGIQTPILERTGTPEFWVETFTLLCLFLFSTYAAFVLSVPGEEKSRLWRWMAFGGLLVWIGSLILRYGEFSTGNLLEAFNSLALKCGVSLVIMSILPSLGLFWMLKKAAPLDHKWSGMFTLLSSAALAALILHLRCLEFHAGHLLVGHVIPPLVLALVGAFAGRLIFKTSV